MAKKKAKADTKKKAKKDTKKKAVKIRYNIDMWRSGVHRVEMGIKKKEQQRAKSRQFTKDTDIIGEVSKDGEKIGYIAIRDGAWNEEKIEKQRLIIKYFTDSLGWKATLEELTARSIANTLTCDNGTPFFMINESKSERLTYIRKVYKTHKWKLNLYTFEIVYDDHVDFFTIRKDRISLGEDYTVYKNGDTQIARIDGKRFDIGGQWNIDFTEGFKPKLELLNVLITFAGAIKFMEDVEERLKKVVKKIKKGEIEQISLDTQEELLYLNPRRVAI
ncbi:MAG: hypothetical protein ACTSYA_06005 [Candidatus Kariarchaeaceae archaeon]